MPGSAPFRLNRSGVMLALVSAAFAGEAGAAAGRTEFTIGPVMVAGRDGVERPLARGTELDNGDVVRTNAGRAQIRFTDGAYVSLQPNTEFGIRDYLYENKTDGSEKGFFGLVKGAMRTVTGLIGRVNRSRYQITTPTATVGIRGTGGVIQVLPDGSTLVIGTSGVWSLTNPAGSIDVPAGVSGLAPSDPNQPPGDTSQQPTSGPEPLPDQQFVQGDERTATGDPVIPFTPLLTGDGYSAAIAFTAIFGPQIDGGEGGNFNSASAVFNAAGQLTELTDPFAGTFKLGPSGHHAFLPSGFQDFGTDGILAWGRWVGEVSVPAFYCEGVPCPQNYTDNQGFHYVIGIPTPAMPTTGEASYSLLGATTPTYADGRLAPGTVTSGMLTVQFGASSYTLNLINFGVQMSDVSYRLDGSNTIFSNAPFFNVFPSVAVTSGTGCTCFCSAFATGFFSGANAERAGMAYHIQDSFTKDVIGAAAFKKD